MKPKALLAAASILVLAASLGACRQAAAPEGQQQAGQTASPDVKPGMSIGAARLVLPAVSGNPGAAYFNLTNDGAKPTELAAVYITGSGGAEIHDTNAGEMNLAKRVALAPGETVKFEPGGKHVMVFDLLDTVKAGTTTEMTLTFADGDKLSAPIKVESVTGSDTEERVN